MTPEPALENLNASSTDPLLCLDRKSLVFAGENSLQFINRRGTVELKGKNLHRLHELFAPHLDGSRRYSELVAAVPETQAASVRSYLKILRRAGALVSIPAAKLAAAKLPSLANLGAEHRHGLFHCGSTKVAISLEGQSTPCGDNGAAASLDFVTPAQAAALLSRVRGAESHGAERFAWRTMVVAAASHSELTAMDLERRAAVARWLLTSGAGPLDGSGRMQIFELNASGTSLSRLAAVDTKASNGESGRIDQVGDGAVGFATLADQLGVISSRHVEQLPLAVATASHPWFDADIEQPLGWRFGLSYDDVRDVLLTEFLARLVAPRLGHVGCVGDNSARFRPCAPEAAPTSPLHAASRRELLVSLLEKRHGRGPLHTSLPVDFLKILGDSRIRCVQRLLGLHHGSLLGHLDRRGEGVTVAQWADVSAASFFPQKAILELLLTVLWRSVYNQDPLLSDRPAAPTVRFSAYATTSDLEAVLQRMPSIPVYIHAQRLWGRAIWSGSLAPAGDDQPNERGGDPT